MILAPETFPNVAERIGLAIAEEEQGLSGDDARLYAAAFRDQVSASFEESRKLVASLGENPKKKRNARKRP